MEEHYLVFDIETMGQPFENFDHSQQEYLVRGAQTDEERQRKIGEMALSPLTGRIVCIGMQFMKREGTSWNATPVAYCVDDTLEGDATIDTTLESGARCIRGTEVGMLDFFWRALNKYPGITLVSFNGRGFDAPYLMLRSALLGMRPPRNLMDGTRFSYRGHIDLADQLSFFGGGNSGPMRRFNFDFYAKAFGIVSPKEAGVDGSMVGDLFAEGRIDDIAEYCLRDVKATWELFLKWDTLLR